MLFLTTVRHRDYRFFYLFKSTTILVTADTAFSSVNIIPYETTEEFISLYAFTQWSAQQDCGSAWIYYWTLLLYKKKNS